MKDKGRVYKQITLEFPEPDATPSDKLRWYVEWLKEEKVRLSRSVQPVGIPERIINEHDLLLVIAECLLTHTHPKYVETDEYQNHEHIKEGAEYGTTGKPIDSR